jgi:oxaloacetate decarboxylase (Na+ extruding) subunit alpha
VASVVSSIRSGANGKPIEIHSHNITGLSPITYLEAVKHGVTILHTASRPLANGASMPSTEIMLRNLDLLGHTHSLDTDLLEVIAEHFTRVGTTYGFQLGVPNEFDLSAYEHQIPGGMTGTLRNQLIQHRMADRLDDVLNETAVVRKELGYPGMMTPFSQLVGTQAVLNIVTGQRYSVIPDEVIKYAVGHYGKPVAPIELDILDRISTAPRYKDIVENPPAQPTLEELRHEYGDISDDELLLQAVVPIHDIDRMRASGSIRLDFPTLSSPELNFVRELMQLTRAKKLELLMENASIELER